MISFLINMLLGIVASIGVSSGIDTKKVDENIEYLQQHEWFKKIYNDEKYRRLSFGNYTIRSYLESNIRTRLLVRNEKLRERFLEKLDSEQKKKRYVKKF